MDILPNNPCALWRETEPFGIHLIPAADTTWALNPLARNDIPLMHITTKSYDSKGSRIINRCCHYVHIISLYDLFLSLHLSLLSICGMVLFQQIANLNSYTVFSLTKSYFWGPATRLSKMDNLHMPGYYLQEMSVISLILP